MWGTPLCLDLFVNRFGFWRSDMDFTLNEIIFVHRDHRERPPLARQRENQRNPTQIQTAPLIRAPHPRPPSVDSSVFCFVLWLIHGSGGFYYCGDPQRAIHNIVITLENQTRLHRILPVFDCVIP